MNIKTYRKFIVQAEPTTGCSASLVFEVKTMLRRFGLVAVFVAAFLSMGYASATTPSGKKVAAGDRQQRL
ncbi:hypothetical protein LP421_25200 [Rhizobium sp. RCAM05350]|nr:hypothetical protein LP421_25200 [Rhizobium sp. RCAM05350]